MGMAQDLGNLICELNPYTDLPKTGGGTATTGDMDIYVDNPSPPTQPETDRKPADDPCQIEVEVDDKYAGTWSFKGEAQRIAKAVRIKYRYPVFAADGKTALYWVDDYLLIGYEGGGI